MGVKILYRLTGLRPNGLTVESRTMSRAPGEKPMIAWGKREGCAFVIRKYPTKGGYRVLDIRRAVEVRVGEGVTFYKGAERLPRVYPNEDTAVMHAMAILNSQPKLL